MINIYGDFKPPTSREKRLHLSPNPERDAVVFKKQMDLMINYPKLNRYYSLMQ